MGSEVMEAALVARAVKLGSYSADDVSVPSHV